MAFEWFLTDTLVQWGFYDFILPFVLVFTIVFAILQKVKIFGKESGTKKYNVVIALVLGLSVVIPHGLGWYPPERDIVNIMNQALPQVSIVLVAVLMALLIIGILGKRVELAGNSLSGWIAIAAFLIILFIFGSAANWWHMPFWLYFLNSPDLLSLIVVILVFAIIIWFVTHEPKEGNEENKIGKQMAALFKGGDE